MVICFINEFLNCGLAVLLSADAIYEERELKGKKGIINYVIR